MSNEILTEIRLELDGFRTDLKDAQKHSEETAHEIGHGIGEKIQEGFEKPFEHLKEKFIEIAVEAAAAFTFEKAIEAASELQSHIQSLNSALAVNGAYSEAASEHFQHLAESLAGVTTASASTIISGEATLSTLGKLTGQGLERATKASLDLAAALRIDNSTAFNLVAKAADGHVAALGRYGISLKSTGDKTLDFERALTTLEGRFKGFAELQTNTFAGALAQTKNRFEEVLESFGNIVIKSPAVIAVLKEIGKGFQEIAESVKDSSKGDDSLKEKLSTLISIAQVLNVLSYPLEILGNVIAATIASIQTVAQEFGLAFAKMALAGAEFAGRFSQSARDAIQPLKDAVAEGEETLTDYKETSQEALGNLFDVDIAASAGEFLENLRTAVDNSKAIFNDGFQQISDKYQAVSKGITFDQVTTAMSGAGSKVKVTADDIAKNLNMAFVSAPTNAFAKFGEALVKGDNAFAAFGKSILASLGQILIQFGSMLIAIGIGLSTVPFLFGLQGPAAVAAGVAAVILGGALTALAGGGGASAAAPSGGGVASGGGGGSAPSQDFGQNFSTTQKQEPQTKIDVNVAGNVFDRKETGLAIADAINEAFGSSGVTFATGGTA